MASTVVFRPVPESSPEIKFLEEHNTGHNAYITHIDKSPVSAKATAFLRPLLLNFLLSTAIVYRIAKLERNYMPTFSSLIGREHPPIEGLWLILNLILDTFLLRYGWPILRNFITGNCWYRLRFGFRPQELVFRKPTGWRRLHLDSLPQDEFMQEFTRSMVRAADPYFVSSNVGFDTRSDFWILDYPTASAAHRQVDRKQMRLEAWDLRVWHKKEEKWWVWEVWKIRDQQQEAESDMQKFQARLDAMGKSHIMESWQELLKRAAVGPDGKERKDFSAETHQAVVELFEKEGVDFEKLWRETISR